MTHVKIQQFRNADFEENAESNASDEANESNDTIVANPNDKGVAELDDLGDDTIANLEEMMNDDTTASPDDPNDSTFTTSAHTDTPVEPRTSSRKKVPTKLYQITNMALLSVEPSTVDEALSSQEQIQGPLCGQRLQLKIRR